MRISQFQKYSQKENTVTNNVLLMLSRLNDLNVNYYKTMIESLNEGSLQNYSPQPKFNQQVGISGGVIDGHIEIKPSKIIIETKLDTRESIEKLIKYGKAFKDYGDNQLWHLSSIKFNQSEEVEINKRLKKLYPNLKIQFNNLLYHDLIENLEGIYEKNSHDMELRLLLEDFSNYCNDSNLISNQDYKLLFVPTGFSFEWNIKHKIYYCPVDWHSQEFRFFGLYNLKSVRSISEIEVIIEADYYAKTDELIVKSKGHTEDQITRLKIGLAELGENQEGLKYYVLPKDEFYETDFKKTSHGGIQGYRYKDLRDYIKINNYDDIRTIAEELKKANWK